VSCPKKLIFITPLYEVGWPSWLGLLDKSPLVNQRVTADLENLPKNRSARQYEVTFKKRYTMAGLELFVARITLN
jgi:hypothetical protein